jgi:hypothetical protein
MTDDFLLTLRKHRAEFYFKPDYIGIAWISSKGVKRYEEKLGNNINSIDLMDCIKKLLEE